MVESLLALGSIPELAMRRCVLGKNSLNDIFHWAQAVSPLWWPSLTKDLQMEPKKVAALLGCGLTSTECLVHTNKQAAQFG